MDTFKLTWLGGVQISLLPELFRQILPAPLINFHGAPMVIFLKFWWLAPCSLNYIKNMTIFSLLPELFWPILPAPQDP